MNINNLSTVLRNDAVADIDAQEINSGLVFPRGSGKTVMFQSGLVWGGMIGSEIRVGGSTYRTGLQPGKIISPGVSEDPNLAKNRIYRVRPDFLTADLSAQAQEEGMTVDAMRTQFQTDWNEWPAEEGAPFTDKNGNGTYEPGTDIPGIADASQTIWFVCNDNNAALTANLYGANPMGIEMQVTVWAYAAQGAFGNTIFKKYVLINKGAGPIDSMYVSQWADPDVGNSTDDFVGFDTTRDLAFAYNAFATDAVYDPLPPPASGFVLLEGPAVSSPGDTAVRGGRLIPGFRNLRMTASYFFGRGDAQFDDPAMGSYNEGTLRFYNYLRGRIGLTGQPHIDPNTSQQTAFPLAGDPVTHTGWIDGNPLPAGDRRMGLACGPFWMAPGDTQEVIIAEMAAGAIPGVSNVNAISLLRFQAGIAKNGVTPGHVLVPPAVSCTPEFVDDSHTILHMTADARFTNADTMFATTTGTLGATTGSARLFDDGFHGDGAAGDRVFGASIPLAPQHDPSIIHLDVRYNDGGFASWHNLLEHVATAGPVHVTGLGVASDNLNEDGEPNPGENVRCTPVLSNGSAFGLSGITMAAIPDPAGAIVGIPSLPAHASLVTLYNPSSPSTYFTLDIPRDFTDPSLPVAFIIQDASGNQWTDTFHLPVQPYADSIYSVGVNHPLGGATGAFDIRIVNPSVLLDHLYSITGVDSVDASANPGFTLVDETAGQSLLQNHSLPDSLGHNIPVTDGFKVFRGTLVTRGGWHDWSIPSGTRKWTFGNADGYALEGFSGAMGTAYNSFFSSSSVLPSRNHSVLIKLAATDADGNLLNPNDTTASNGYRYLRSAGNPPARPEFAPFIVNPAAGEYAYQDYRTRNVPFAAYDLDRGGRRMMVGFLENNQIGGRVDGKYWPDTQNGPYSNTDGAGPREWFFLFDVPYGTTADASLMVDILNNTVPMMWWGTPNRRYVDHEPTFDAGDEFLITANHPPATGDRWTFNPKMLTGVREKNVPLTFALRQNYPNPFNPRTMVAYELAVPSRVTLKVFNLLGQEVRMLVNRSENAGTNSVAWDGRNAAGRDVGSGVYFYRIEARPLDVHTAPFRAVRKMLLVR